MFYETTILVPANEVQACHKFLNTPGRDVPYTFKTYTKKFANGVEVDIRVCQGTPPFVEPVLYDDENEIWAGGLYDNLLGIYRLQVGENEYKVTVQEQL